MNLSTSDQGETAAERAVVIRRVFDASPRLLFLAHTTREHVMRWFGPRGWPLTLCELDFREGGRFRFAMTGPDGVQGTPFGGTYLEIEPDRTIVYDNGFEGPGAEKMTVSITFEEHAGPDGQPGQTALTMRTVFPSAAMFEEHVGGGFEVGVGSSMERLEEAVAAMRAEGIG